MCLLLGEFLRKTLDVRMRQRLKIAIVDDEDLARAVVREYLAGMPDVEIVAECANGFEAVKAVSELQPDLLILDEKKSPGPKARRPQP